MLGPLLITLREGLEAALIIGIVMAYLARTGNRHGFKPVWLGAATAILVSMVAGAIIYVVAGELSGRAEQVFEGLVMFTAVGVLTWMVFWMRRQTIDVKAHLHAQLRSALTGGSTFGLAVIAFLVVVREGIETALFLFAATRVAESSALFAAGAGLGLALAVVIGYTVYRGTAKLNLKAFFNVTSLVLIIFAAGLLAHGMHEFHEAAIIPPVIEHVWDTNSLLPEASTVGRFLTALTGYNGNPSLVEVVAYVAFLGAALTAYLLPARGKSRRNGKEPMKVTVATERGN